MISESYLGPCILAYAGHPNHTKSSESYLCQIPAHWDLRKGPGNFSRGHSRAVVGGTDLPILVLFQINQVYISPDLAMFWRFWRVPARRRPAHLRDRGIWGLWVRRPGAHVVAHHAGLCNHEIGCVQTLDALEYAPDQHRPRL